VGHSKAGGPGKAGKMQVKVVGINHGKAHKTNNNFMGTVFNEANRIVGIGHGFGT